MSGDPILELSDVGYVYPGAHRRGEPRRWALDGVNLRIGPGERIALLGANGSGKSTLLAHLNGILRPDRGCVRFRGRPLEHDRRSLAVLRTEVAMVFQNADDQLFGATVREDLSFGPVQSGWPSERVGSAVDRILGKFGLDRWANDDPLSLSHGLRKRVAIAGAVAVDPRVLVLDEPTAGLDPSGEDELESILSSLSESGTSVVVSTHDVDFAFRFAQRVILLYEGRILADGESRSVLSDREALRTCRLRSPRDLVGMSRVGVAPAAVRRGGLHVISLHPSALPASRAVASQLGAQRHVHETSPDAQAQVFSRIAQTMSELWDEAEGFVVFAPVGLCVRTIAPMLGTKRTDPAVVCCDVLGRWAVSLLSGHEGGANALAYRVAQVLDAEPVVTTTSEAVRSLVAGIGCRRGVEESILLDALDLALTRIGARRSDLRVLASSEAKRNEPGLHTLSRALDLPLRFVAHREIKNLRPRVRRSAAHRHFSVPAVSQPAALLAGRRTECVLRKFVHRGVTVSLARERCAWSGSDPDIDSIAP